MINSRSKSRAKLEDEHRKKGEAAGKGCQCYALGGSERSGKFDPRERARDGGCGLIVVTMDRGWCLELIEPGVNRRWPVGPGSWYYSRTERLGLVLEC